MSTSTRSITATVGYINPPGWETIHDYDFASAPTGAISQTTYRAMLGDSNINADFTPFTVVTDANGSRCMNWRSAAGTFGTSMSGTIVGIGANVDDPLTTYAAANGQVTKAAIEYSLKFPSDMDWSLGGKLPGLAGAITGNPPSGCVPGTNNGFSSRFMWWPNGRLNSYRYRPGYGGPCGEDITTNFFFSRGVWHTIRKEIELNSVSGGAGTANGVERIFADGALVRSDTTLVWRNDSNVGINFQAFSFFRGGSDSTWAGAVDNDIRFDNFKIQVKE